MLVRVGRQQQALLLEVADHALASLEAVQASVGTGLLGHPRFGVDDQQLRQPVTPAGLEVVRVVTRCDLDRPGAEQRIDELVGHDRYRAPGERDLHASAHELRVALVIGMHGDAGVSEQRLGTRRGHHDVPAMLLGGGIADRVHLALHGVVDRLQIGDRGVTARAPVDDVAVAVDQPLLVEPHENGAHRA